VKIVIDRRSFILPACTVVLCMLAMHAFAADTVLRVPRIARAPKLEDFEAMAPAKAVEQLAHADTFIQKSPSDGKPATERTEAYLGYDQQNLYVIMLCWDSKHGVRASLTRREPGNPNNSSIPFDSDDYVEITLDTFQDQRHAFVFDINPKGVQADALWTEGQGSDYSWDTLWYSRAKISNDGYVIWAAIPFRSLRFHPTNANIWGVTLSRYNARADESDYWPRVSSRVAGLLNQEAKLTGFENVSPGRNMQFIPYVESQTFRGLDTRDPSQPRFDSASFRGKAGLDSKFVFHDSLVLDATINPDFAQVESDEPQNTVNQRFEVFFPEKRPFFLENSNFFEAPLIAAGLQPRMVFTRRIADPTFGVRLTGKEGPWNMGFLVADDRSPGLVVPPGDPDYGQRAHFAIGRVSHDIGEQSSIGAMFTDREFMGQFNRAGGLDGTFHLNANWNASYRGYMSSTLDTSGYSFGQHHDAVLIGNGRRFTFNLEYLDITPHFIEETGFVPRVDQRTINQYGHFYWRPEGKHLVFHGPEENTTNLWDHTGTSLQQAGSFDYVFGFRRNIILAPIVAYETDTLRPVDFTGLPNNRSYTQDAVGLVFRGSPWRVFSWSTRVIRDGTVVVVPAAGQLPYTGDETAITQTIGIKPVDRLQIDNTYILERVTNGLVHHAVVNSNIFRSKWNYQFTREFSLRVIAQYNGLLANPQYSSLQTTKDMNFDVLFTYFLHPGTAVYVGYNSNLENVDPALCIHQPGSLQCDPSGPGLLRTQNGYINDGRQLFVKVSYLFRR
jgi:Domain of unknown function (DUF5916)